MFRSGYKILVVDDDPKVLQATTDLLSPFVSVLTAEGPMAALAMLEEDAAFAVIVSAYHMPGMNGVQFLKAAEEYAPSSARIMLTADQAPDTIKHALNDGHIFMFLSKPCPANEVLTAVRAGVGHHKRLIKDRILLEKTLAGSVKMLIDMLSLFHPEAFRKSAMVREQALKLAHVLRLERTWELEMSVMLSPLGEALLPKDILARYRAARSLTQDQRALLAEAPEQTRNLLKNIPRLSRIAEILYLSGKGYDGSGFPENDVKGKDLPLISRILRILTDLWYASPETGPDAAAFEALWMNKAHYDVALLQAAQDCLLEGEAGELGGRILSCHLRALQPGDVLIDDILTEGTQELVLSRGHQLSATTITRLLHYERLSGLRQPVRVRRIEPDNLKMV